MQKNWIYDILNNWKSGVIVYNLNKRKVKFCNDYLKQYEQFQEKTVYDTKPLTTSTNLMVLESGASTDRQLINPRHSYSKIDDKEGLTNILIKNNIFKNLFDVNEDLPLVLKQAFLTKDFEEIINLISELYNPEYSDDIDNSFYTEFIFLGRLNLNNDSKIGLFELYMHGLITGTGIYYEFMVNDVTKTKMLEDSIIKEKTLILGKISHEFKNPLIVIDEVVEQIIESKDNSKDLKKMNFIQTLCNYMIILVKDFEVVANIENNLKMDYSIDEIELPLFLNDIDQIISTLIVKKVSNQVTFKLNIDRNIGIIKTDSIRLKQILINLLSNSVKFTDMGTIELKAEIIKTFSIAKEIRDTEEYITNATTDCKIPFIQPAKDSPVYIYLQNKENENNDKKHKLEEEIFIRFSIIDSGKGISNELVNIINTEKKIKVIQKENSNDNKLGTGYGLNIVQKLCTLLDSKLYAKQKEDSNGSIFYFDIKQDDFKYKEIRESKFNKDPKKITSIESINPIINLVKEPDFDVDNQNIFEDDQIVLKRSINQKNNNNNIKLFNIDDKLIYDKYERYEKNHNSVILENDKVLLDNHSFKSNILYYSEHKKRTTTINDSEKSKCNHKHSSQTIQQNFEIKLPKHFLTSEENKENYFNTEDNKENDFNSKAGKENVFNSKDGKENDFNNENDEEVIISQRTERVINC